MRRQLILNAEEQSKLSPQEILEEFKIGNERFRNGKITKRDHSERIRKSAPGQFPKAVILSCLDSRVPVEDVFDQGIGDIFVARVAGNFVNEDILGSMELACKVSGAKLIIVMGHQHCGAIIGAINKLKMGNITNMLAKINPAIELSKSFKGDKNAENPDYVRFVAENNVKLNINKIRKESKILNELEQNGTIKIVGAFYRLTDGTLEFID
jgi:carbonic anhydrase